MNPPSPLLLHLFGGVRLERDGVPVSGRAAQKRRLAILVLLATHSPQRVSRDRIVGLLWPDAEPDQARKLLSEALYVIRRELGEELIETAGDEVSLSESGLTSDLQAFREALDGGRLADAEAAYAGPFADGWYVNDAPDFERWIEDQRAELARRYSEAVQAQLLRDEADGNWAEATRRWRLLCAVDPYRSSYVIGLARALASVGERPAAIQALVAFEQRVRAELQVRPDDEVVELAERLRREGRPLSSGRTVRVEESAVPLSEPVDGRTQAAVSHKRSRIWYGGIAVALLLMTAALLYPRSGPNASDLNRLAVLYFRDASPERDLGPTADVITEALIEQLAGVNAFEVVPYSGVKQFRASNVELDSIGRALGAGSIVDGTVQRHDDRLVVSIRLIEARGSRVVWSSHFDGGTADLLELQRRIAREVAAAIREKVGSEVRLRELNAGTRNERARQLAARANRERDDARELLRQAKGKADVRSVVARLDVADSLYGQAAAEDPKWIRAIVERGWTAMERARLDTGTRRVEAFRAAARFADAAAAIAPQDPTVLELRGTARWRAFHAASGEGKDTMEVVQAVADLRDATGRDSMMARAWGTLSHIYWVRNNPRLAYLTGRRALEVDTYLEDAPRIIQNLISASVIRFTTDAKGAQAEIDTAYAWCRRGRALYPNDWRFVECEFNVMKYDERSTPDPARAWKLVAELDILDPPAAAEQSRRAYAPLYRRLVAAAVSARAGDLPRARSVLADAKREAARLDGPNGREVQLDLIPEEITLQLLFGNQERAAALLDTAIAARPILSEIARNDPILVRVLRGGGSGARRSP